MNRIPQQFGQNLLAWGVVSLALTCSACVTNPQMARSNSSENGALQAIYKETVGGANPKAARKSRPSNSPLPNPATSVGDDRQAYRDPALQQIGYTDETLPPCPQGPVLNAQPGPISTQCPPGGYCPDRFTGCPPEPRWPAAGPNPFGPGMMACDVCNLPSHEKFPDEYLCDGGDRDLPVHYSSQARLSLDTEDTVLEYTDRTGVERMKASNRVCIYAPRFASVRTVSRPQEEHSTNEVAGLDQLATTRGIHTKLTIANEVQRDMMGGVVVRSRVSGLESESTFATTAQLRAPSINEKLLNVYQALTFVRLGRMDESERARLSGGIQAAALWTREQFPIISAKTDMAIEGHFEQAAGALTIVEEKEESENLRIVKLADKQTALPGDVIQFTIRYDNLGGREVHYVRIVDNLTPRLQYVEDSATSDRAGRLVLQDNGEGSQILIWEMDEPLKGKSGGVVTFNARVR
jgi:uncharacterized repeat protein (TIGR01451 family)